MFDTLLAPFSSKHQLYKNLKLKSYGAINLTNYDSIAMSDVFPFNQIQQSLCKPVISNINFVPGKNLFFNPHAKDSDTINYIGQDTETHKPIYLSSFTEELAEVFNPIFPDAIHLETPCLIDLSEINGFLHSKSDLSLYRTIEEFVLKACPSYVNDVSIDKLEEMLSWPEFRLLNSPETTTDQFAIYGWSPKIFVQNAGGSHHMGASHYLAKKLNQCVPIQGKVSINLISKSAFEIFDSKYAAFAIHQDALIDLSKDLAQSGLEYQLAFFRERDIDLIFFKKTAENARIIALLNKLHTSLNDALKTALEVQSKNESLLMIMSSNLMETSNDSFFSTRPDLAEVYKQTQNEICMSCPKPNDLRI